MMRVELVYDGSCPNVAEAKSQLKRAFAQVGLPPRWQEWDRASRDAPGYVREYGSPTILVDGEDIGDPSPLDGGDSCRLYGDGNGRFRGIPPLDEIIAALLRAKGA